MNYRAFIIATAFLSAKAIAQAPQPTPQDDPGPHQQASSILGNAALATNADPFLPPRIGLRTYKLSANIGKGWFDFYLHNNLPTFLPNAKDSLVAFSNEILNHLGGVANVAFGKLMYFGNGGDVLNRNIRGGMIDIRAGAKFIDPPTRNYAEFLVPTMQGSIDVHYLIPLSQGRISDKTKMKEQSVGNLSFRAYGTYQHIFRSEVYQEYFKTRKGNPAPVDLVTLSYEVSLFLSNAFYISYGQSFGNIMTIPDRTAIAFNYTAPIK